MKKRISLFSAMIALLLLSVSARADGDHTFTLDTASWDQQPSSINLAGEFNGWSKDATPMKKSGTTWSATVKLSDGPHAYKFVADGERWLQDPKADPALDADDGNGGKNSVVIIGKNAAEAPKTGGVTFSLDTSSWEQKPNSIALAGDFNDWSKDATSMTKNGDTWSVTLKLSPGNHAYKFVADGERWLQDPKADAALDTDDGNGGKNSGIKVGAGSTETPPLQEKHVDRESDGFKFALDTSSWPQKPKQVNLAGEFNGWNKDGLVMNRDGDVFWTRVPLEEGVYAYKFVADGKWMKDPNADATLETDDGNGGQNSGTIVGPDARKMAAAEPNAINTDAVLFNPKKIGDLNVVNDHQLRLRIRAQDGDAEHVYALTSSTPSMSNPRRTELHKLGTQWGYASYGGLVDVPSDVAGRRTYYSFELTDGTADVFWDMKFSGTSPSVSLEPSFTTPEWTQHAVWYQIFPERFRNGDTSNDPAESKSEHMVGWTSRWYDAQPGETPGAENFYEGTGNVWKRRYGGDIQGIRQSLPYLKSLGVTAIYLNPIFEAESMHKYDTTDYRHVDSHFGVAGDWPVAGETEDPATWKWTPSDKVFLDFVAEAHKQGFKVVIDGVFNHVGLACPFFQDVLEKGKNSKYADWFEITDWGDPANWHKMDDPYAVHGKPGGIQWRAWDKNNGALPAWKKNSETGLPPGPMKLINDITVRWLAPDGDPNKGVDGFRLDAANEVPHPFWVQWRQLVKKTKPDAYISGEIWSPAQPWINDGKEFDAVMNYQFAMPTLEFFANVNKASSPTTYASKLTNIIYMYPEQASLAMMNLFDSHDTDRMASMFVNPDRGYDAGNRQQDDEGKQYDPRKPTDEERQKQMQAVAMQMTFLGSPMVYYGDEAGMWSADDPSDRQPMTWPGMKFDDPEVGFDQNIFDNYQRLIAVRNTLPALQDGDYYPVVADDADNTLVFARRLGEKTAYVAFNRSHHSQAVKFKANVPVLFDFSKAKVVDAGTRPTVSAESATPVMVENGSATIELPAHGYAIMSAKP